VEIKCQLDATELFIADLIVCSTCFGHHYAHHQELKIRGGVRSTRNLGPTMTARGHSIGTSIGMLPKTLIISRLDQLSRLGARISFFHYP